MMNLLFGTWTRRIITLMLCLLTFAAALTGALAVGVLRAPSRVEAAREVPVVGGIAVWLAKTWGAQLDAQGERAMEAALSRREIHPLSAQETIELVRSLKDQMETCKEKVEEVERERKRLELYRQELVGERDELLSLRQKISAQWDDIKATRATMEREVTELSNIEARNLKKIAATYEAMKPDRAAAVLKAGDESTAAKVLSLMRERSAAKVLDQMDQEDAAKLTERIKLLKRTVVTVGSAK